MIVLYGGTFDPIHEGHIHLAKSVGEIKPFDTFYFVPTGQNPLKDKASASAPYRLEMIESVLKSEFSKKYQVLDWELKRSYPNYTIHTLEYLHQKFPKIPLTLLMGDDVFSEIKRWYRVKDIFERCHFWIIRRKTVSLDVKHLLSEIKLENIKEVTPSLFTHSQKNNRVEFLDMEILPFSSTLIRQRLMEMWSKNVLQKPNGLTDCVWEFIKEHHVYAVT